MDSNQILKNCEVEMGKAVERFKEEVKKIHTGRATPVIVEDIPVEYYGSKTPIKQIASINIPEPRMIVISPWNKDDLITIQKALSESDLKVNPQNDGEVIRITLPSLTEERRREMAKLVNKEKEDSRISIRQIREDSWDEVQKIIQSGGVSEDDKFRTKDKLQTIVNRFNKELDEIAQKKEEEIMTI